MSYSYICDICNTQISNGNQKICELCGKDLCIKCSRYICSKIQNPSSPIGTSWTLVYPGSDACLHQEEMIICKNCFDTLKLSIRVSANKK